VSLMVFRKYMRISVFPVSHRSVVCFRYFMRYSMIHSSVICCNVVLVKIATECSLSYKNNMMNTFENKFDIAVLSVLAW